MWNTAISSSISQHTDMYYMMYKYMLCPHHSHKYILLPIPPKMVFSHFMTLLFWFIIFKKAQRTQVTSRWQKCLHASLKPWQIISGNSFVLQWIWHLNFLLKSNQFLIGSHILNMPVIVDLTPAFWSYHVPQNTSKGCRYPASNANHYSTFNSKDNKCIVRQRKYDDWTQ